jgi:hypothetical protein
MYLVWPEVVLLLSIYIAHNTDEEVAPMPRPFIAALKLEAGGVAEGLQLSIHLLHNFL